MDVIASTGFGLRVDSQSSKDNPFVVNAKKIMNLSFRNPLFLVQRMYLYTDKIMVILAYLIVKPIITMGM